MSEQTEEATPPGGTVVKPGAPRLLLVEDNSRLARALRRGLAPDYQVDVAYDGDEALERLATSTFALIVCDMQLPDVGGDELRDRVAAIRPELAARFLFVTGGASVERVRSFLAAVDVPWLAKPFTIGELRELIRGRLEELPPVEA